MDWTGVKSKVGYSNLFSQVIGRMERKYKSGAMKRNERSEQQLKKSSDLVVDEFLTFRAM